MLARLVTDPYYQRHVKTLGKEETVAEGIIVEMPDTEEWSAGLLGATIIVPRGAGVIEPLIIGARLDEIERRILAIEAGNKAP